MLDTKSGDLLSTFDIPKSGYREMACQEAKNRRPVKTLSGQKCWILRQVIFYFVRLIFTFNSWRLLLPICWQEEAILYLLGSI